MEYLPNFTLWQDWQVNTEASISSAFTELLSLKTSYLIRYDHAPNPGVVFKTDTTFTTSLVAKF